MLGSQVYIDLKEFSKAVEDCDKAIALNPKFVKALYRKSIALGEMTETEGTDEQCIQTLTLALNVAKENPEGQEEMITHMQTTLAKH